MGHQRSAAEGLSSRERVDAGNTCQHLPSPGHRILRPGGKSARHPDCRPCATIARAAPRQPCWERAAPVRHGPCPQWPATEEQPRCTSSPGDSTFRCASGPSAAGLENRRPIDTSGRAFGPYQHRCWHPDGNRPSASSHAHG
jgi:hypothetical protein